MTITVREHYETIEEAIAAAPVQQERLAELASGLEMVSSTYINEVLGAEQKRYEAATILGGFLDAPVCEARHYHLGYARWDGAYETVGRVLERQDYFDRIETAESVAECTDWRKND